jgi:hypothetical protein
MRNEIPSNEILWKEKDSKRGRWFFTVKLFNACGAMT